MKIGLFCFTLLFTTTAVPAVDKTATNGPAAIPWSQIGAKAGAGYQGDGLTVTPTAFGARLHCVFQRLDAEATPEGLWLTSTVTNAPTDRFRVTAMAIGRTENFGLRWQLVRHSAKRDGGSEAATPLSQTLPPTGTVTLSAQTVRFTRPGLTEEYTVSMDGLRQDFIVEKPPAGHGALWSAAAERSGDAAFATQKSELAVKLSVTGATVEPAPDGARLVLENSGRKIAYSRLRVTDATGKELPARIEVFPVGDEVTSLKSPDLFGDNFQEMNPFTSEAVDSKLAILINDTDAVYPLRIDPTFSDTGWVSLGCFPGIDGVVFSAAVDNSGNLYLGGEFTGAGGGSANYIAEWNGSTWLQLGSGMNANSEYNGNVLALAFAGNTLYAGGYFTNAGGVPANYVARWDGTNWSALGLGVGGVVFALAVSGNMVYAGGYLTNASGVPANYVARWDGTSWSALGSGVGGQVTALAVSDNMVYAGGDFTNAGSVPANNIAQWDGSTWLPVGTGLNDQVNALAVLNGALYAGGYFTNAGGVSANYIAQWDGTNWSPVGSGMNGALNALAVSGSNLYAGGTFSTASGISASNIARWDGTNWSSLGTGTGEINTIAGSSNALFAGGYFGVNDFGINSVAEWNGNNWSALGAGLVAEPPGASVNAFAVFNGTLYAGGLFSLASGNAISNIARWNGNAWLPVGPGLNNQVNALAVLNGSLYAGGEFTAAGSNAVNYIAQWDGTNWSPVGSGVNGTANALAVSGSNVYVGGTFSTASGITAFNIAQWNGTIWSPLGSGINGSVDALAVSGSSLYAGGSFSTAGGNTANKIARWDGTNWYAMGTATTQPVSAITILGGTVYVGSYDGGVFQWDGTNNWIQLGSNPNFGHALAAWGNTIIAGAYFETPERDSSIAVWNGTNWSPLGSGLGGGVDNWGPEVSTLLVSGNTLYVGGQFATAGPVLSANAAIYNLPVSLSILTTDGNFGFTNGIFGFDICGPSGSNVIIQASANLQTWIPLQTNSLGSGLLYFSDSQSPNNQQRFYRAELSP